MPQIGESQPSLLYERRYFTQYATTRRDTTTQTTWSGHLTRLLLYKNEVRLWANLVLQQYFTLRKCKKHTKHLHNRSDNREKSLTYLNLHSVAQRRPHILSQRFLSVTYLEIFLSPDIRWYFHIIDCAQITVSTFPKLKTGGSALSLVLPVFAFLCFPNPTPLFCNLSLTSK